MNLESLVDTAESQDSKAQPLPVGHRMGELELTGVIGVGGFGIVYRAFDHALQRVVAVKEYMPSMLATRGSDLMVTLRSERFSATFLAGQAGFINEARLLAQFDHPGLIKVLRFWEDNGTAYMATPFYEGQTLTKRLAGGRALAEAEIMRMMAALLGAIETLHRAQCFHRDIALDNIVIQPDGRPVLLDFGAARKLIGDMVDDSAVMLKSGYAPIEQYTDDPAFRQGPWTDLYALGAVIHVLVSGELPPAAVIRSIQDNYVPLARRALSYSVRLRQATDQALQLRVTDRPQSVAEFAQLLGLKSTAPGQYSLGEEGASAQLRSPADQQDVPPASKSGASYESTKATNPPALFVATAIAQHLSPREEEESDKAAQIEANARHGNLSVDPSGDARSPELAPSVAPQAEPLEAVTSSTTKNDEKSVAGRHKRLPLLLIACVPVVAAGLLLLQNGLPRLNATSTATPTLAAMPQPAPMGTGAEPQIANLPATAASERVSKPAASATGAEQPPAVATRPDPEARDWARARQIDMAEGYRRYLRQYSGGKHESEARALLEAASRREGVTQPPSARPAGASVDANGEATHLVQVKLRIWPWGEVYIAGKKRGVSPPLKSISLAPGSYDIEVRNGTLLPYRTRLVIAPGATTSEIAHSFG